MNVCCPLGVCCPVSATTPRRVEYYPTVVFLTTNKLAQAALGNWAIVMAIGMGRLVSMLFLGPLRDIEIEVIGDPDGYCRNSICSIV